jgi:hypothetical protein
MGEGTVPHGEIVVMGDMIAGDQTNNNIAAGDIVGRDKASYVSDRDQTRNARLPKLSLQLIELGNRRAYLNEIDIDESTNQPNREFVFGFVLENSAESTSAKGIGIRIEVFWRGDAPLHAFTFRPPRRPEGWTAQVNQLTNDQPAIMTYSSPDHMCFYRQPCEWVNFRLPVQERLHGYALFHYTISSMQPHTDSSGDLKLVFA